MGLHTLWQRQHIQHIPINFGLRGLCRRQKCKCLHHGKDNTKHNYYINTSNGREPLPDGEEEKDLGVYFSINLNFDKHINESVRKANMTLGLIKRNFSYINKDVLTSYINL